MTTDKGTVAAETAAGMIRDALTMPKRREQEYILLAAANHSARWLRARVNDLANVADPALTWVDYPSIIAIVGIAEDLLNDVRRYAEQALDVDGPRMHRRAE